MLFREILTCLKSAKGGGTEEAREGRAGRTQGRRAWYGKSPALKGEGTVLFELSKAKVGGPSSQFRSETLSGLMLDCVGKLGREEKQFPNHLWVHFLFLLESFLTRH